MREDRLADVKIIAMPNHAIGADEALNNNLTADGFAALNIYSEQA